jgi:hypothetical protein
MNEEKVIVFKTHWRYYHTQFMWAYATIPLLGYGFFKLNALNQQIEESEIQVFDDRIVAGEQTFLISNLNDVIVETSDKHKKNGLADIILGFGSETVRINGIEQKDADILEDVFLVAIRAENERKALAERGKGDYADEFKLGGLEHMNSLVGLWQQGLISDEDYQQEQKKFKK